MSGHKATSGGYTSRNVVADTAGAAAQVDPNLVNAWGLVAGPSTPWWVNNNQTNTSTLYDGTGAVLPLVVTVPGGPPGIVFNGGSGFMVSDGTHSGPATFIFSTESGVLSGWNHAVPPPASTQALTGVDRSGVGAVYRGLAIASTAAGDQLYAADFHNARVDVFDSSFNLLSTPGAFVDDKIPRRYAPHGIQNINGTIFVTYAKREQLRICGLWGLQFGNGGPAGPTNTLYFTAGPKKGSHGLFGSIQSAAAAATTTTTTPAGDTTTSTTMTSGTQTHTVMVGEGG